MIKFGTDGWRAVIADEFTFSNVKILSQAISEHLKRKTKNPRAVIGYDRRFLSDKFAESVARVFLANKIEVVLSDKPVPTPVISFNCLYHNFDMGIMITASHNPHQFNGLKIKTRDGASADKTITDEIEKIIARRKNKILYKEARFLSIFKDDLTRGYIKFLKKYLDTTAIKKIRAKILIDIMYGVGDGFAQEILGLKGGEDIVFDYLHKEDNPGFGGVAPEPTREHLSSLISKVKQQGYSFGVCLDGDADRIAAVDNKGNFISAQVLLPLLALHMIKIRKSQGGIGKTVVGSNVIDKVASFLGRPCYETPVGFKYLSRLFIDNLICIGGEEAGGIGFEGYIPERDGNVAFLLLLEMCAKEGKDFNELLSDFYKKFGRRYYKRIAFPLKNINKDISKIKFPSHLLGEKVERINTLDGIKLITKNNWLMFRKSGTEPIVRVYAETPHKKDTDKLIEIGAEKIK